MNVGRHLKKAGYLYGRLKNEYPHVVYPAMAVAAVVSGGVGALKENKVHMYGFTGLFCWMFYNSLVAINNKIRIGAKRKTLEENENNGLEDAEIISIDDHKGLETLLSMTGDSSSKEWGTVLKAHPEGNVTHITEILDNALAIEYGLVSKQTRNRVVLKGKVMDRMKYNGTHHFHPDGPLYTQNYAINTIDRSLSSHENIESLNNSIHLLSFNTPDGPEVIGFNNRYTYLPIDGSKKKLIRATPKEIMKYVS